MNEFARKIGVYNDGSVSAGRASIAKLLANFNRLSWEEKRRFTVAGENITFSFLAATVLIGGLSVTRLDAQGPSTATQALQKAHVMERLTAAKPTTHTGM